MSQQNPIDRDAAYYQKHLRLIESILEQDECQCIDPPEERAPGDDRGTDPDDPAAHSQYCPVYLAAYVRNLRAGIADPDPDDGGQHD